MQATGNFITLTTGDWYKVYLYATIMNLYVSFSIEVCKCYSFVFCWIPPCCHGALTYLIHSPCSCRCYESPFPLSPSFAVPHLLQLRVVQLFTNLTWEKHVYTVDVHTPLKKLAVFQITRLKQQQQQQQLLLLLLLPLLLLRVWPDWVTVIILFN